MCLYIPLNSLKSLGIDVGDVCQLYVRSITLGILYIRSYLTVCTELP